ncbi:1-phosphofructokinase [Vibrio sp. FNV 38]|nr:1-phosphofructokinase [Vibrio sp. FNV 38]
MKITRKVVTVTLNPALDLTGTLDVLTLGSVSLVNEGTLHPAGKGVNVAQVLSDLGAEVTVTGFLGQDNQAAFVELFQSIKANDQFVRIEGATRINVKLVEANGHVSDINFPGLQVRPEDIIRFEQTLESLSIDHDYFIFSGSLPQGISAQRCASWIATLQAKGKRVLFDSSRSALAEGLKAKPWMIKPNDDELSELMQSTFENEMELLEAAEQLSNQGITHVVVSCGSKGVIWQHNRETYLAYPPSMNVVSTVGAGDTFVGGFCWGAMQCFDQEEQLSFATALSALAVGQVGVGVPDITQVCALQKQVSLSKR